MWCWWLSFASLGRPSSTMRRNWKKRREKTEEKRFVSLPALVKLGSKKSHEMLVAAEEWEGQRQQIQNLIHHLQKPFPIISNTSYSMSRLGRVCVLEDFRSLLCVIFCFLCSSSTEMYIHAVRKISIIKIKRKFIAHFALVYCFPPVLSQNKYKYVFFPRCLPVASPFILDPFCPCVPCYRLGFIPIHISWKMVITMQMKVNRWALASAWRLPLTFSWFEGLK